MWAEFLSARLALQPSHTFDLDAALTYPPGTLMRIVHPVTGAAHSAGDIVQRIDEDSKSNYYRCNFKDSKETREWRFRDIPGERWELELV